MTDLNLCPLIKPDEELNYNEITIYSRPDFGDTELSVYPFTNCYPFNRESNLKKWNELACKIFKYETKKEVVIDEQGSGLPINALTYRVFYRNDNGSFRVSAKSQRQTFRQDRALNAIKQVMESDVIKIVNELIEIAWKHKKMIECFPEFNSTITETLQKNYTRLEENYKTLLNKISDLEIELFGVWEKNFTPKADRSPILKRLEANEDDINELRTRMIVKKIKKRSTGR